MKHASEGWTPFSPSTMCFLVRVQATYMMHYATSKQRQPQLDIHFGSTTEPLSNRLFGTVPIRRKNQDAVSNVIRSAHARRAGWEDPAVSSSYQVTSDSPVAPPWCSRASLIWVGFHLHTRIQSDHAHWKDVTVGRPSMLYTRDAAVAGNGKFWSRIVAILLRDRLARFSTTR